MALPVNEIFGRLWEQYTKLNPEVQKIHDLFVKDGHNVVNDHIAFRTFNNPKVCKEILAKPFIDNGYEVVSDYKFEAKKLDAIHLAHKGDSNLPKVFISELRVESFSDKLQAIVKNIVSQISEDTINSDDFIFSGRTWPSVTIEEYETLRKESEYCAWLSTFGYMANHFTVKVNALNDSLGTIEKVNDFVEKSGYPLNSNGGKVKGTPNDLLVQSSTLANKQVVKFADGEREIPTCFYEFAYRFKNAQGEEFAGFIAGNADKIFTSTNVN